MSDTHMPRRASQLPGRVTRALCEADLIVHLGDFTEVEIIEHLESYAELHGVHGNNDSAEVRARMPASAVLDVKGHSFLLMHGHVGGRTAIEAARKTGGHDAVLFGHSHRPWNSMEGGRLLFNPGSPTDRRWNPYLAFGILDVGKVIRSEIIPLLS